MTPDKPQPNRGWRSKLRLILILLCGAILLLELTFSIFRIPAHGRPITPFDIEAVVAVLLLICLRPKLFSKTWRLELGQMPVIYKICAGLAVYVLVLKIAYFSGYLTEVLKSKLV